jgi:muramidase (phage lysozyme)
MGNPVNPAVANLLPVLDNPNVRSFLDMISAAEGTTQHGYNTLFGGGKMESLTDHPRQLFDFTETTGRPNKTTAAGRYQFLSNTWDEQAKKLGLPDFGERSQDLAAVNLLQERGILPDVLQGNWESAVKKSGPIWASLPSSNYPQPRQSQEFVMSRLNPNRMYAQATTSDANPNMANPKNNPFEALNEEFRLRAPVQAEAQASMPTSFRKQVPVAPFDPQALQDVGGDPALSFSRENGLAQLTNSVVDPQYYLSPSKNQAILLADRLKQAQLINAGKAPEGDNANFVRQYRQAQVNSSMPTQAQTTQSNPFAELNAEFALTPVQSQAQAQPVNAAPAQMPWSDVAYGAVTNLPASAGKYGKELYEAVTSPIETVKNIGMVGGGAIINQLPKSAQDWLMGIASDPQKMQQSVQMAQAVGGEYAKKYGSIEGFKKALSSDPVSVIGDMSILLTGGGAVIAKAPGLAKAGQVTGQIGRTIDPLNLATKAVTKPAQLAGLLASEGAGFTTGAGGSAIREAAQSGFVGGEKANAFLDQLRSNAPVENVVNTAKSAVAEMRDQRANAYRSGMVDIKNDKSILSFDKIDDILANKQEVGMYKGQVIQPSTVETWQEINQVVQNWKRLDPAEFHTPEGLDRLKMRIGDIRDNAPFGTPARNVADAAYNAIKNEINTQAPGYAKVMKDYELASNTLKDIENSLSLGKKANIDTSVRKLQSIMRNNANTNYGRRVEQAQMLEGAGAETLMPQLAGQALSSWTPRSLQGIGSAITAAGSAVTNPAYLASLPLTMPRVVGESAYYAGKAAGTPQRLAEALKRTSAGGKTSELTSQMLETLKSRGGAALDPYTLRMLATKLGQQQTEEQR